MKKIIYRFLIFNILILSGSIIYLSTIGVKTDRLNNQISNQIKNYDNQLQIKLNKVSVILDPFKFKFSLKTIGTELKKKDKTLEFESIKSDISIKSLINNQFSITELNISTRSLEIKKLISFIRLIDDSAQLFMLERFINDGFLIADIKLKFNEKGKVNKDYSINGFVKAGSLKTIKKINLSKIDFFFDITKNEFNFTDIKLSLNDNNLTFPKIEVAKDKNRLLISGINENKKTVFNEDSIKDLININSLSPKIKNIEFDSNNAFSFSIDKKYQIKNFKIQSELNLISLSLVNDLKLKVIFPDIKDMIYLTDHKILINYTKNSLDIKGEGDILFQNIKDKIKYDLNKKKNIFKFDTSIKIFKNDFKLDLLNYKKIDNSSLDINFKGNKNLNSNKIFFKEILVKEEKNYFKFKNLLISKNSKIKSIDSIDLKYQDRDDIKNQILISRKNKDYEIKGSNLNASKIIDDLLKKDTKSNNNRIFDNDFRINLLVDRVYLDKENLINDFKGYILFKDNEVVEANIDSQFEEKNKLKFIINSTPNEKITTLYTDIVKPFVNRYEFIKGFEEGNLDFYSIKNNNISRSKLIIDNFKVQEIPVLAKLLTLASLQGIADLLTGEGIRFTDFEMRFSNEKQLMKIEELYAIGPAISIMAEGYIESNKLISLKGTLVPATTINRTIASIPVIGNILVGKKVGEGVFGVSFKVKGPPKDLKTSVNPVKTLTPRFITRTLEKIKKSN